MATYEKDGIVYEYNLTTMTAVVKYVWIDIKCAKILSKVKGCIVTEIGRRAFYGADHLKEVYIPDTVVKIKNEAFADCFSLTTINKGTSLLNAKNIGIRAFYNTAISVLELPSIHTLGKEAFKNCVKLKRVVLSDDIEVLEEGTFTGCFHLNTIVLPENIRVVKNIFQGCSNMQHLYVKNKELSYRFFIKALDKKTLKLYGYEGSKVQELSCFGYDFSLIT